MAEDLDRGQKALNQRLADGLDELKRLTESLQQTLGKPVVFESRLNAVGLRLELTKLALEHYAQVLEEATDAEWLVTQVDALFNYVAQGTLAGVTEESATNGEAG